MGKAKTRGFTIIEVILFLAVSAVLLGVVIATIGGRQQRAQFTDSMRDLQSYLETQLSDTQNGVNPTGNGGDAATLMLGRALAFTPSSSTINVHTVSGNRLSATAEAACISPSSYLSCAFPAVEVSSTYNILWGATFTDGWFKGLSTHTRTLAFLRNPRATTIIPVAYAYNATQGAIDRINTAANYNDTAATTQRADDVDAYYCFRSANGQMTAALTLVGAQVGLVFSPTSVDGYNCT